MLQTFFTEFYNNSRHRDFATGISVFFNFNIAYCTLCLCAAFIWRNEERIIIYVSGLVSCCCKLCSLILLLIR